MLGGLGRLQANEVGKPQRLKTAEARFALAHDNVV